MQEWFTPARCSFLFAQLELPEPQFRRHCVPPVCGVRHGEHVDGMGQRPRGSLSVRRGVRRCGFGWVGFDAAGVPSRVPAGVVVPGAAFRRGYVGTRHPTTRARCNPCV